MRSRCGSSSGRSTKSRMTSPPARPSAVSTESVSRRLDDSRTDQPVDDHLDGVLLLLLQLRRVGQRVHHAVDPGPGEALGLQLAEQVDVLALAAADHRGQHLEPGALGHLQHPVDDLLRGLPADRPPAHRAVRPAGPRVEQPEVVVDLGDRADGRARVAGGRLLVDRDRRRQALDEVDVGLVHLAEELPRVRRQRLDVAPLALGEDRVEGQAGLARPGQPGEHDQASRGRSRLTSLRLCSRAPRTTRRSATGCFSLRPTGGKVGPTVATGSDSFFPSASVVGLRGLGGPQPVGRGARAVAQGGSPWSRRTAWPGGPGRRRGCRRPRPAGP